MEALQINSIDDDILLLENNTDEIIEKILYEVYKGNKIEALKSAIHHFTINKDKKYRKLISDLVLDYEIIDFVLNNLNLIFLGNDLDSFLMFINTYEADIIKYLSGVIISSDHNDIFDRYEFDDPKYYPKDANFWDEYDVHKIIFDNKKIIMHISTLVDGEILYHFYKKFKNHIIFNLNEILEETIFYSLSDEHLLELFELEYKEKNYNSCLLFNEIVSRMIRKFQMPDLEMDKNLFRIIFIKYKNESIIEEIKKYENNLMEKLEEKDDIDDTKEFDIFDYLSCFKYLYKFDKKELRNQPLYKKLLNIYIKYLIDEQFNLTKKEVIYTDEDLKMIELVFNRMINQRNICKLFKIKCIQAIYLLFRTDILDNRIFDVDIDEIKNINGKHFIVLKPDKGKNEGKPKSIKIYKNDKIEDIPHGNKLERLNNHEIIFLLNTYGYEYLNYFIKNKKFTYYLIELLLGVDKNRIKDEKYKNIFMKLVKDLVNDSVICEKKEIILQIFDYMYDNGYERITKDKIKKRIKSLAYLLMPNNIIISPELEKLNLVTKGIPYLDMIEGIKLYNVYRFRKYSTIPEVEGNVGDLKYNLVDMHDPKILSNGIEKYIYPNNNFYASCLTPNGKAKTCLKHGATNVNGRFLSIYHKNRLVGYAWIWRQGDVLVIDNLELTEEYYNIENNEEKIYQVIREFASKLINSTKDSSRPIKLVALGKNEIDVNNKYLASHKLVSDELGYLFRPHTKDDLYLKDSENCQIIIDGTTDNLDLSEVDVRYKYKRKKVFKFNQFTEFDKIQRMKSIYFDYCILRNIKPSQLPNYKDGYIGEDWFLGIKDNNEVDIFVRRDDEDIYDEIKKYTDMDIKMPTIFIPKDKEKEELKYLLLSSNYIVDAVSLNNYIKYISSLKEKECVSSYFHTPSVVDNLHSILIDGAITSHAVGNRVGCAFGTNGQYYICLAKIPSKTFDGYKKAIGFGFDDSLCVFRNNITNDFKDSDYPLRSAFHDEEYQVKDLISLDRADGIYIPINDVGLIPIVVATLDAVGNNLPIYLTDNFNELDKDVLRDCFKLKKR